MLSFPNLTDTSVNKRYNFQITSTLANWQWHSLLLNYKRAWQGTWNGWVKLMVLCKDVDSETSWKQLLFYPATRKTIYISKKNSLSLAQTSLRKTSFVWWSFAHTAVKSSVNSDYGIDGMLSAYFTSNFAVWERQPRRYRPNDGIWGQRCWVKCDSNLFSHSGSCSNSQKEREGVGGVGENPMFPSWEGSALKQDLQLK